LNIKDKVVIAKIAHLCASMLGTKERHRASTPGTKERTRRLSSFWQTDR